jgi:hypothetical protein
VEKSAAARERCGEEVAGLDGREQQYGIEDDVPAAAHGC